MNPSSRHTGLIGKSRKWRLAGAVAASLLANAAIVAVITTSAGPAAADTAPYPVTCSWPYSAPFATTAVTTGSLSTSPVLAGGGETLNNYGISVTIPESVVDFAVANGNTALTGSVSTQIDATGISPAATPETLAASTGTLTEGEPATVSTQPPASAPVFTAATSGTVAVAQDASLTVNFTALVDGIPLPIPVTIDCTTTQTDIDSTVVATVPDAPASISVTPGNGQISISWTAPYGGGYPVSGYVITAAAVGGGSVLSQALNTSATSTILGGLTNGTSYDVTVAAVNQLGTGPAGTFAGNPVIPTSAAPLFTSANTVAAAVGHKLSFKVDAAGTPKPTLTASGLPGWLTFTPAAKGGSGTLTGTPPAGAGGVYAMTFSAANGVGFTVTQAVALSVLEFTSPSSVTFPLGQSDSLLVQTSLSPGPVTMALSGALPPNVSFEVDPDGEAVISGTPSGAAKTYHLTLKATYASVTCTLRLTLTTTTVS
jgi:large repetitive protein